MTNLKVFDSSLKLSWLRRIINQTEGWVEFPIEFNISNIFKYGDVYIINFTKRTKNKFWKDILLSVMDLQKKFEIKHFIQVQNTPLWYNSQLNLGYRKDWVEKGYYLVKDILDDFGELRTKRDLNENGIKLHFLDFESLKFKVNELMHNIDKTDFTIGPHLPRILFETGITQKGCSGTYKKLMDWDYNIIQDVKQKWEEVLNEDIPYLIVENAFKYVTKIKESAYYKYLQFKMLHSRTIINEKLYIMKISESNICEMCMIEVETIKHAYIDY